MKLRSHLTKSVKLNYNSYYCFNYNKKFFINSILNINDKISLISKNQFSYSSKSKHNIFQNNILNKTKSNFNYSTMISNNNINNKDNKDDKYLDLLYQVFNLKHWRPKEIHSLDYMYNACEKLGIDITGNKTKFIHITGTNGKGTVSAKIENTLRLSGLKTGIFTSPHISSVLERIKYNGELIEPAFIERNLTKILELNSLGEIDVSFFDALTLLMLLYFQQKDVDIAVIEVGCGGLLDSTNVINPLLSIITSIGYDHTAILGNTKQSIAFNKAGIIKKQRPCVIGNDTEPKQVFYSKAKEMNSEIFEVNKKNLSFEEENTEIARLSLDILNRFYSNSVLQGKLNNKIIEEGLKFRLPCRLENVIDSIGYNQILKFNSNLFYWLNKENKSIDIKNTSNVNKKDLKIFLDVGHNPAALEKVFETINSLYPNYYVRILAGFSSNKDFDEIIKTLLYYGNKIYFCTGENVRLTTHSDYVYKTINYRKQYISSRNSIYYDDNSNTDVYDIENHSDTEILNIRNIGSTSDMIKKALSEVKYDKEIIIVLGSFFIMKDARMTLGYEDIVDAFIMQEKIPSMI